MTDLKTTVKELRTIHAHIAAAGLLGEASSYPVVKMIVAKLRPPCKELAEIMDRLDAIADEQPTCPHCLKHLTVRGAAGLGVSRDVPKGEE